VKVKVPVMVQDEEISQYKGMRITEQFTITGEDFFLDGPVTRRVAVLNFDTETGALLPGVRFQPASQDRELGRYEIADENDIHACDFNQVSVFGTVLQTIKMFEEEDNLGRQVAWAFMAPQLLVVPRAGEWANAYYERESHSLQFFYFRNVYTSLSRDIVAHETGHAVLDGIAPDLYNAITPQSLALHESVADLTALIMAFRSGTLCEAVLDHTGGSIECSTAFSSLAEELGRALGVHPHAGYLRSLLNEKTLDPNSDNPVARSEPHALSEVLSGALYKVMVNIHEAIKHELAGKEGLSPSEIPGVALWRGHQRFKRMMFRPLDYLPPGEVSFADYGRAIIASDQASYPDDEDEREWIREEFVRRHMVADRAALEVKSNFEHPALKDVDLQTLIDSDWAAYEFANHKGRELLGIPEGIPFRVRPRRDVTKLYYHRDSEQKIRKERIRECLFKVSWDSTEPNQLGSQFPRERQITVGSTLAIDWETRKVRALLTSRRKVGSKEQLEQQGDRDLMLSRLVDEDLLQLSRRAIGPDGKRLDSLIVAESTKDLMRIRGTARMLHIVG